VNLDRLAWLLMNMPGARNETTNEIFRASSGTSEEARFHFRPDNWHPLRNAQWRCRRQQLSSS